MAARILRIVFRLDYDGVNCDFLDRQGSALRILTSVPDGFWSRVGDGTMPRSFAAEFSSDNVFRNLNASAMSLDGSLESRSGIDLHAMPEHREFRIVTKIIDTFANESKITKLGRCGLRLYCLDTYGDEYSNQFTRFSSLVGGNITPAIETALGKVADLALTYEGRASDGVSYRIALGPFEEGDLAKLLGRLRPSMKDEPLYAKAHVSMDLDFFEHDVSFRELTIQRWARTNWAKADAVLDHVWTLMLDRER
jgi:hypothetical protein